MNRGQKLYIKAKKIILGGNMLLSKRPEMFAPNIWPSYFLKSLGTTVWDMDKKKYTDMIFSVGQNTLGYNNKEIDKEVLKCIKNGNMTTLNCPEEVLLTKKLIKIHPWAGMAKYARSGGEANAIAIRIARAASSKDGVAICGYHGWHDWYLSVNLTGKEKLAEHLLKGLDPIGVPKSLRNLVHPFRYGDIKSLKKIIKKYSIGVIKMEVARGEKPNYKFLKAVRSIATKKKIVLVFDECTSGFRRNFGGLHMSLGIYPDIAMFGKALGNGYAITAVLGKKSIMQKAEKSFISSTFWTERIGFVAGLKTLEIMEKKKSWEILMKNGKYFNKKISELALKYKLKILISGIESITSFSFQSKYNLHYKTYITQEMLKKNYLASNLIFISTLHNKKIIDLYIKKLDPIFKKISFFEKNKLDVSSYIKNGVCHKTFQRLND
jgi:glutamate-1-semialdehyde aminotransferase